MTRSTVLRGALLPALAIAGLNLLAHFIPFERVALSGDDIQLLTVPPGERLAYALEYMTTMLRRPLEVSYAILHWVMGEHKALWVVPVFLSAALLAVAVYFLMRELLGDPRLSMVCSVLFVLFPNKAQLYHNLAYTHVNGVLTFTVAGFALFMAYLRDPKPLRLWAAVACYTVTIFWYELGFLLPCVLAAAALFYGRRKLWTCALFLVPVLVYFFWRAGVLLGGVFDLDPFCNAAAGPNLLREGLDLYAGRQMMKYLLYGAARFPHVEMPWLFFLIAADLLALWGGFRWLRKGPLPPVPWKALPVSAAMGVFFLTPAAMGHGILGRHTTLASIGVSILVLAALRFVIGDRKLLAVSLTVLFGAGLVISQGLAWSQVVSCRMNDAVLETLLERKETLSDRRTKIVFIDQYGLSQKISYTWVKDPRNHLDTYWGVDGLPGDNYSGVVRWVAGRRIPVRIIRSPIRTEGKMFVFEIYNPADYRIEQKRVPTKGVVRVGYPEVYPRGFHNGRREPR